MLKKSIDQIKRRKLKFLSLVVSMVMVLQLGSFSPCTYAAGSIDDLCEAVERGDRCRISSLLKEGVNPNQCSSSCKTPLFIAIEKGYKSCVTLLLLEGADPDCTYGVYVTPFNLCKDPNLKAFMEQRRSKKGS